MRPVWLHIALAVLWLGNVPKGFPQATAASDSGPIQDNGFLVEEAYNQEEGVVQHISSLNYFTDSKDWAYSFTQEWPVPGDARHQFSYTLNVVRPGDFSTDGAGIGDLALNYRYQLIGSGQDRVAMAPRFSLLLPAGDSALGHGFGSVAYQANLPVSVAVTKQLVMHLNAGGTVAPNAKNAVGEQARATGFNLGHSFIWLAHARFNVMLETLWTGQDAVSGPDRTEFGHGLFVSPGIRWAHNFENGLQIVPGAALAIGAGPSDGEKALIFYLSFEHPFTRPR